MKTDIAIIGAGIVGLATAYRIMQKNPKLSIQILEKEANVSQHQTGHNSGVIHSGIYYKPGSLKALNCLKGYKELIDFAEDYGIGHDVCGKIIVATKEDERGLLDSIYQRGLANGLNKIKKITPDEVREIEPYVKSVEAVWVPYAGIIDYPAMCEKMAELLREGGHSIHFNHKTTGITMRGGENIIHTEGGDYKAKVLVSCAGLYADKVTKYTQPELDFMVLPFRGEYYKLKPEREYLAKNLIYPVPNPNFPFLGVHFTRMIRGGIEAGPNAVLAFRREGYHRSQVDFKELFEILRFKGFRKIARKYWRDGLDEMHRSYSKHAFVRGLQHLIPDIKYDDLTEGGAGVRAMACDVDGNLIDDFLIVEQENIINVCNAPSPAATASLSIGDTISDLVLKRL